MSFFFQSQNIFKKNISRKLFKLVDFCRIFSATNTADTTYTLVSESKEYPLFLALVWASARSAGEFYSDERVIQNWDEPSDVFPKSWTAQNSRHLLPCFVSTLGLEYAERYKLFAVKTDCKEH